MRTVTSTVLAKDGRVIPVKTDRTIPKEKMFECMELINATVIELPVTVGQVLLADILGTGANLVATANADESL
jgi:CxxC motif-containing protein